MTDKLKPFANESDVLRIGDLEIENRLDRVTLNGDLVLTRDKTGLVLARQALILLGDVVKVLEADPQLPAAVKIKQAKSTKNPFA